jgi:hypothetical protein
VSDQITLAGAKAYIPVIHDADDDLLADLLAGAVEEALQFCDRAEAPTVPDENSSSEDPVSPSFRTAVYLLVKAAYRADPDEAEKYRHSARTLLFPFRATLGA